MIIFFSKFYTKRKMNSTESLLRNATHNSPGWIKLNCNAKGATEKVSMNRMCIRVGNTINCNGDIMRNYAIREYMENIMQKYNITNYMINTIETSYEFSYELSLPENIYKDFYNAINDINDNNE